MKFSEIHKQLSENRKTHQDNLSEETVDYVDVDAVHDQALREHLLSNPSLFEDIQEFDQMQKFLNLHATPKPLVNNQYVYASVRTTPIVKSLNIAHFEKEHQLVKLDNNSAYFEIDGKIKRFPETGKLTGDALTNIYFFGSKQDLDQFETLVALTFSDYKKTSKTLDHVATSLKEGQYEMRLRNGQVKKFVAQNDADAKRISRGHGAMSVIKLKDGIPAGAVKEHGVREGSQGPDAKIASLEKKYNTLKDRLGLARERRKIKGQHVQSPAEMKLSTQMLDTFSELSKLKQGVLENTESADTLKDPNTRGYFDGLSNRNQNPHESGSTEYRKYQAGFEEGLADRKEHYS
jgi:hypothetical protein